jgi:kinesin family protein 11
MGENSSRDFSIKVSYVEVYNERIRDLLADDVGDTTSQGTPQGGPMVLNGDDIQIRVSGTGEVTMNCVTRRVITVEDVLELLILGNSNRVVAKTDMNNHSSRSHAIFRITVESSAKGVGVGAEVMRVADFNLVDLAGSESSKASASSAARQKEGAKINQRYEGNVHE